MHFSKYVYYLQLQASTKSQIELYFYHKDKKKNYSHPYVQFKHKYFRLLNTEKYTLEPFLKQVLIFCIFNFIEFWETSKPLWRFLPHISLAALVNILLQFWNLGRVKKIEIRRLNGFQKLSKWVKRFCNPMQQAHPVLLCTSRVKTRDSMYTRQHIFLG